VFFVKKKRWANSPAPYGTIFIVVITIVIVIVVIIIMDFSCHVSWLQPPPV
jgi:hypothetical protein